MSQSVCGKLYIATLHISCVTVGHVHALCSGKIKSTYKVAHIFRTRV